MKFNMKIDGKLKEHSQGDETLYSCLVELFIHTLEGNHAYTEFYKEKINQFAGEDEGNESN